MEGFAVTCPLVLGVPHLVSGSCSSPRALRLGFLQTPPHGDALVLLLAFGSAITWREDSHPARSVSCLAHTTELCGGQSPVRTSALLDKILFPPVFSYLAIKPLKATSPIARSLVWIYDVEIVFYAFPCFCRRIVEHL